MSQKKNQQEILKLIRPILKRSGILRSSLFGSFATGKAKGNSDVDILISPPSNMDLFTFVSLKQELESKLGKRVDLVSYRSLSPFIKSKVYKEAIKIL